MSKPAAKDAAVATTEQRSLENESILRQVLMLLIGQGVFVRTVAKGWLKSYESVVAEAAPIPRLHMRADEMLYKAAPRRRIRADQTLYEAAFSSVKCVELAQGWGFNLNTYGVPRIAGRYGDIATLQRAGELGMRLQDAVEGAAESGHLDVLKWLHIDQKHPLPYRADEVAARSGHAREMLQWLKETGVPLTEHATYYAAAAGDIDALEYLHVEQGIALSGCYTAKDLATLKWVHSHNGITIDQLSRVADAAAGGNKLSTLLWAKSVGAALTKATMMAAVEYGHIEMIQHLIADGCMFEAGKCYRHAVQHGQADVLK
jgi:hypothetical protein